VKRAYSGKFRQSVGMPLHRTGQKELQLRAPNLTTYLPTYLLVKRDKLKANCSSDVILDPKGQCCGT